MKLTISGNTIEVPDEIKVFSYEQFMDFSERCSFVEALPIAKQDKEKAILALSPMFCAVHLQPLRDGFYSPEKVDEIWQELRHHPDKETVNMIGQVFCVAVGQYFVTVTNEMVRQSLKDQINKRQN